MDNDLDDLTFTTLGGAAGTGQQTFIVEHQVGFLSNFLDFWILFVEELTLNLKNPFTTHCENLIFNRLKSFFNGFLG